MPLGWYLAQGLIPLGPSSSDDEEGPCELPNGRLVCGPHGLVCCGKCCVDYSFMDDVLSQDSEDDDEHDDSLGLEIEAADSDLAAENWNNEDSAARRSNTRPLAGPELRRGTGRVFPTKFAPPSASITPLELFSDRSTHMRITRQVSAYLIEDNIG
jgi:ribonuclease HI